MLVAMAGPWVLVPVMGATGLFLGTSGLRALATLVALPIIGGAVAGLALGRGWRGSFAFAAAFPVGAALPLFAVTTLHALSGRESAVQLAVWFGGSFSLSFALLGTVGTALVGWPLRVVSRSALAFASAGLVGGIVLASVAVVARGNTYGHESLRLIGVAIALLLPAGGGGWWLSRFADRLSDRPGSFQLPGIAAEKEEARS